MIRFLMFTLLFMTLGCVKHSSVQSLIHHELSPDKPFCNDIKPVGPSQLGQALAGFQENIAANKTGVYSLETGGEALINRAWLTDNATKSIDAQYFIFGADNVGMIATERLLLAAERGVVVRLLVDDLLAHGDAELLWGACEIDFTCYRVGLSAARAHWLLTRVERAQRDKLFL